MKKQTDFVSSEKNTGDAVISRGYAIFDEWAEKKLSSRKIVDSVNSAVGAVKQNKTNAAISEALSFIFALDLRVNEKYGSFWNCLIHYFSWRRETGALRQYKNTLHITEKTDIRTAIEIELQRLREKLEGKEFDDGKDEDKRGGKRNGKAEEEAYIKEEKGQDPNTEESTEEFEKEEQLNENSEETVEQALEQIVPEEQIPEPVELQPIEEILPEAVEEVVEEIKLFDEENLEKSNELTEENNGLDEESEPIEDKHTEEKTYNDAVDSPPLYEERESREKVETKMSFIDEVIIDNMIKHKEDFIHHNPVDDVKTGKESTAIENAVSQKAEDGKRTEKDAYLYDKTAMDVKEGSQNTIEKSTNAKTELKQSTTKINEKAEAGKTEKEALRVPLQVNINETYENNASTENQTGKEIQTNNENQINNDVNNNILEDSAKAFYNWKAELMKEMIREQLNLAGEDFDDDIEIIGMPEPEQMNQQNVASNRK